MPPPLFLCVGVFVREEICGKEGWVGVVYGWVSEEESVVGGEILHSHTYIPVHPLHSLTHFTLSPPTFTYIHDTLYFTKREYFEE